jgi:trigger factor
VDYTGTIDGVAFPGGTATDAEIEVGGGGFIPGFTEQVRGMMVGWNRTIEVTFPADYASAELAGKQASFAVTAKRLRTGPPPVADERLATTLGFEGLAEVRQAIAAQVQREYDQLSRMRLKRELLDALAARATFAVPSGMVEGEFGQIWQRLEADRARGEVDADDQGKSDEMLRAEYRAIAERRVRLGLLLAEIGRANAITVGADEMTRAIRAEAMRYPGQEQQVLEFFRKNAQATEMLRGPLLEEKVVNFVLELARVTDRVVAPDELTREPEAQAHLAAQVRAALADEAAAPTADGGPVPTGDVPDAQPRDDGQWAGATGQTAGA